MTGASKALLKKMLRPVVAADISRLGLAGIASTSNFPNMLVDVRFGSNSMGST